jgi:predicted DNA binding CopG/RHH family protein
MKNKYELTEEEKLIEREADNFTPIKKEKKKRIENIIEQTKKNKAISLRITNYDLEKIKEKAEQEGLPYQTLITNVLHKYITNQLYGKDEIIKSIKLLKEEKAI